MEDYIQYLVENVNFNEDSPIQTLVYKGLRTVIMQGLIPFGVRLNEMQIAKHLNISRTPIREAVRQLQFEGFLEAIPNYGTVVKQITRQDVYEVYQLRVALETLAFTSAMNRLSEEELDYLDSLLDKTLQANQEKNHEQVVKYSAEFNSIILEKANMPRLKELLTNLQDYLHRFRTISMTSKERGELAIREHQLIVKAMRNKNEEQIRLVIEEHVNYSKEAILRHMQYELD